MTMQRLANYSLSTSETVKCATLTGNGNNSP